MPIVELEGSVVGEGCPGPITLAVWDEYWALHYDPKYSVAIDYEQDVQETPVAKQEPEAQEFQKIQEVQEAAVAQQESEAQELQEIQQVQEVPSSDIPVRPVPITKISSPELSVTPVTTEA